MRGTRFGWERIAMAEKATPAQENVEETSTSARRRTTTRTTRATRSKKLAEVSPEISGAVATELEELKHEAPARTSRRAPRKKATSEALEVILPATKDEPVEVSASPFFVGSPFSVQEDSPLAAPVVAAPAMTALLFQEPDMSRARTSRRSPRSSHIEDSPREGSQGSRASEGVEDSSIPETDTASDSSSARTSRRRRTRGEESTPSPRPLSAKSEESRTKETAEENEADGSRHRRGSRGSGRTKSADESTSPTALENSSSADSSSLPQSEDMEEGVGLTRRRRRRRSGEVSDEVSALKGSTRLEAKRQRRKEGREAGRRRHSITESEYLARRESVKREMLIREQDGLNQIAVLEDDVLVEHYVARHTQVSMVGNVYLGRVQNVLPSMEAAFVDIGKGRNAVLYAGEVNWESAGLEGKPRRIEQALKSGDTVLVQVTKDPIGHKGARLTAQITLAGRHLVLVPSGAMTGISRKLPEKERQRLKKLLREIVPAEHGVIVRTAAEGASEEQLRADVERLTKDWTMIQEKSKAYKSAPTLVKGEPELAVRVVRDIFNEDFDALRVQGEDSWGTISSYVGELSPELMGRVSRWTKPKDIFTEHRVDEQLAKAFDRKVWLPSGGTLVIDRTEAMTVVDVNTGKFTGSGGTLEETVTRNNLEAAEEIVRQLRLRDIGGIIVVDFIDMVLETNRELVLRRLVECLGRDRTRHQVAEVTSLGLVQMTRKRVGQGLVEAFSTVCDECEGRGFITHTHPVERTDSGAEETTRRKKNRSERPEYEEAKRGEVKAALNSIAAAAAKGAEQSSEPPHKESAEESGETSAEEVQNSTDVKSDTHVLQATAQPRSAVASKAGRKTSTRAKAVKAHETRELGDQKGAASLEELKVDEPEKARRTMKVSTAGKPKKAKASKNSGKTTEKTTSSSDMSVSTSGTSATRSRTRRVVSSGTITPGGGSSSGTASGEAHPASFILSFPA